MLDTSQYAPQMTTRLQSQRTSHAARIQMIARDRDDAEPVNHDSHRRITAARLAADAAQPAT